MAGGQNYVTAAELDTRQREALSRQMEGLLSQNFHRQAAGNTQIMIDGTVYFMAVPLLAGDVVNKVVISVTTAGTGTSTSKCGIYDKFGNKLAASADQASAWDSTGIKEVSLSSAYTVTASDLYYLAVIAKTGTTMPTLSRGNAIATAATAVGAGAKPYGTLASQTDLPATAAIVTTNALAFWIGAA